MRVNILALTLVLLLSLSFLQPTVASAAGLFSFLADLFSSSQVSADTEILPNSQNMALLQAVISPASMSTSTESIVPIVEQTSLSPETQGPLTDGKDHSAESDQISLYVVRSGDTLPAIAKMFNVTTNTIVWANNLKNNKISVGDQLVILPISGLKYTVKSGDTLSSITKKFKGNLDDILSYNNLQSESKLAVGDIVFIPDGEIASDTTTGSSAVSASGSQSSSSVNTGSGTTIPVGRYCQNYPAIAGYYLRPVTNCVKTQGIHGHNAIDLAGAYGTNIMAAAAGTVIVSRQGGWNGGYGNYVVIRHNNGTQTLYAHMSKTSVSVGDSVSQGEIIGFMGSTGDSTGTHLHFEIRGARNPF